MTPQLVAADPPPAGAILHRLLRNGYFPAELPPPFTTRKFAEQAGKLAGLWRGADIRKFWTEPEHYSIPRYGHMRRRLSLVNPVNQLHVAHLISNHWSEIHSRLQRSKITEFRPEIVLEGGGRAVTGVDFGGIDRRKAEILARYGRYIKTDFVRFYPSVYTHAIAWAIRGKQWVKDNHRDNAFTHSYANYLDRAVAAGQLGQTIGIPIGPDSSRLLSELIATELEEIIREEIPDLDDRAVRYVDDLLIGLRHNENADTILAKLSVALYQYELELNGDKTSIHGLGFAHAPERKHFIRNFSISDHPAQQREDLSSYFEQAIHLSDVNPRANVLLFAARRSAGFSVLDENWDHLINLLLYTARRSTTCLGFIVQHLSVSAASGRKLPLDRISEYVHYEISIRAESGHTAEVAWLLFWARELNISLCVSALDNVVRLKSSVCALLTFDMIHKGLIDRSLDTSFWGSFATTKGLQSEMWLIAYEATKKNWWAKNVRSNYIRAHNFFGEMWSRDVQFYEPDYKSRPQAGDQFFAMISSLSPDMDFGEYASAAVSDF